MTKLNPNVFVYDVISEHDGQQHFYVSPLPYESGFKVGLRPEAIMGELTNGPDDISPTAFKQNVIFTQFLVSVVAKHSAVCPGVIAEAKRQQNGLVCIVDLRTPTPDGPVPPEDIVGVVEIRDGEFVRFHESPKHLVLTKDGFMQLDRWLHDRLVEELDVLSREPSDTHP